MNNTKGFTLIEVIMSAAVIALVMVGVIAVFVQTVNIARRIDYDYAATNIAKARIEFVRAFIETSGFDALTESALGESDTRLDADGVPDSSGDFYRSTTVSTGFSGNVRLTEVRVVVDYVFKEKTAEGVAALNMIFADI